MKTTLAVCGFLFLSTSLQLLANGGGYATGGVSETGAIVGFAPEGTEAVQILQEDLDIALKPAAAVVEVVYQLENLTETPVKVRFGFPVEELDAYDMNEDGSEYEGEAGEKKSRQTLEYCRDYEVEWQGEKVKSEFELQPDATLSDPQRKGIRGWLISEIEVPAGEPQTLKIRYQADYPQETVSVSDDSHSQAKLFQYRLSTGAVWAGPIANGTITVRADGVPPEEVRVLTPAGRFKREGETWKWTFENLEPTLADDLKIEAAPEEKSYGSRNMEGTYAGGEDSKPVSFIQRGDRWFVQHSNFSKVSASSVLAPQKGNTYNAENVSDGEWETVWVEGAKGSGAGEWIEAELEVPQPVYTVAIRGGYQKDDDIFQANARPKRVEIVLNGEHRFEADMPDEQDLTEIPVTGYKEPVKNLRVIIKDVYPGNKWPDCAITSLSVSTPLAKAPNVQPAR